MSRSEDILRQILAGRGVEDFEKFLHPTVADLAAPEELPGVSAASEAILEAVTAKKLIVVFGDYDCDGVSATAILVRTLTVLGARVEPFIPDRLSEGYGMSEDSIARLLREHADVGLVVTVDNGVNSIEPIAVLKARGIRVVVTDHHLPGEELPVADAIVDPKVAAPPHLSNICGAGVAFLLANHLVNTAKKRGLYSGGSIAAPLLVLAGIATVTDIMPLRGQNRILVSEALRCFRTSAPLGLQALYHRAARTGGERMTSHDFAFLLGPRINAAGRMRTAMEALELILSDDHDIANELARMIENYNTERKTIEQEMSDAAMEQLVADAPAQVIYLPHGHPGVAGIVASRVLEKLGGHVPVCVFASGHGSGRAPVGFNLRDAFQACAETLDRFGGHAVAGGFSVKEGQIDAFREALCAYCRRTLPPVVEEPKKLTAEAWIEPSDINLEFAEELTALEPYGEGNPVPILGFRGVRLTNIEPLGHDKRHLLLDAGGIKTIWWQRADLIEDLRAHPDATYDMAFTLEISTYQNRHVELRLVGLERN